MPKYNKFNVLYSMKLNDFQTRRKVLIIGINCFRIMINY